VAAQLRVLDRVRAASASTLFTGVQERICHLGCMSAGPKNRHSHLPEFPPHEAAMSRNIPISTLSLVHRFWARTRDTAMSVGATDRRMGKVDRASRPLLSLGEIQSDPHTAGSSTNGEAPPADGITFSSADPRLSEVEIGRKFALRNSGRKFG